MHLGQDISYRRITRLVGFFSVWKSSSKMIKTTWDIATVTAGERANAFSFVFGTRLRGLHSCSAFIELKWKCRLCWCYFNIWTWASYISSCCSSVHYVSRFCHVTHHLVTVLVLHETKVVQPRSGILSTHTLLLQMCEKCQVLVNERVWGEFSLFSLKVCLWIIAEEVVSFNFFSFRDACWVILFHFTTVNNCAQHSTLWLDLHIYPSIILF